MNRIADSLMTMYCQVDKHEHFRHLLIFAFNQGSKGSKAARDICSVYREGAISERTAQRWFSRLKKGKFDVTDSPRSGRLVQFNEDRLNELMHKDPHQSTRELAQQMGYSNDTLTRHLHSVCELQNRVRGCQTW
ncbi:Histone-lysine N-methyltransferase SETMAR [Trichinella papuae]|uniref:Histone-lysine N-methyltransferase SETMAR n=1 Tax=Trichinella papuae TaxID=268474 RepID=A0A0V1M2Q4_9BILA|nr:Histone-lysine N-methyltransferase SETMAR [Trichinella papuae]